MKEKFGYLPQNERKKILLICDDIRVHSGVATVAREIVTNSCQHFNWVNVAGAINHPEQGKKIDLSESIQQQTQIEDAVVYQYPVNGYGDANILRQLLKIEKPDAIMIITDPRYFEWLFQIENEIRKQCPIIYLNIWDSGPAPLYNKVYYESCDLLMSISKQTKLFNELVLGEKAKNKIIEYVPHGLDPNIYYPIEKENEIKLLNEFKTQMGLNNKKFVLFFNSRNIRRKQIPDAMLAWKYFLDTLPKEEAHQCTFVLHTEIISEHGTDLEAVRKILFNEYPNAIKFSTNKLSSQQLNYLYNIADAQILLSSNEGWGLTLTEAILAGTPIIANVTGGMQDQMGFLDDNNEWYTPTPEIPSNHTQNYEMCGDWAFPVFPSNRSLQGSPKTPYIWDDRCNPEEVSWEIERVYNLSREERKQKGKKGREWAMSEQVGFTSEHMANRVIKAIDQLFNTWNPREQFELIDIDEVEEPQLNHNLLY
jgi:glycosyltransferase involved in cell wall biosynthesis